jgi:hypothetical protein
MVFCSPLKLLPFGNVIVLASEVEEMLNNPRFYQNQVVL